MIFLEIVRPETNTGFGFLATADTRPASLIHVTVVERKGGVSEPRFERHQLSDVLQKAAELQEGRADPGAVDRLGLRGIQQMVSERESAGPPARAKNPIRALFRFLARALKKSGFAIVLLALATPAAAQHMPVGDEAFRVMRQVFDYDATLPLDARTLQRFYTTTFSR
jgi:hypothetical protein